MKPPRLTMGRAMLLVAVVAVDFALVRLMYNHRPPIGLAIAASLLTGNIAAFGLHRLVTRRQARRPFLVGFVAHGIVGIAVSMVFAFVYPNNFLAFITATFEEPFAEHISQYLPVSGWSKETVAFAIFVPLIGLPQFCYALFGGLLCHFIAKACIRPPAEAGKLGVTGD